VSFKVVLVGQVDSSVAKHFITLIRQLNWSFFNIDPSECKQELTDIEHIFLEEKPYMVVHLCSEIPEQVDHNLFVLNKVITLCEQYNVPLINQSSYLAVSEFDSDLEIPETTLSHLQTDASQVDGSENDTYFTLTERACVILPRHINLRVSWLLDSESGLFSHIIPQLLDAKALSYAVSDHDFGAPVSNMDVAQTLVSLIQQVLTGAENWGVFHFRSSDMCSEAEFSDHLSRLLQKEYNLQAAIPAVANQDDSRRALTFNARLSGRRITDDFGIQAKSWRKGLIVTLKDWLKDHQDVYGIKLEVEA